MVVDKPSQVNVNQLLAELVQAKHRIAALECAVASMQQMRTGDAQVAGPPISGEHSVAAATQSSCAAEQTEEEKLQQNLMLAQQYVAASLTSFANRHKPGVM